MKPLRSVFLLLGLLLQSPLVAQPPDQAGSDTHASEPSPVEAFVAILDSWTSDGPGAETAVVDLLRYTKDRVRLRGPTPRSREAKVLRSLADDSPGAYIPLIGLYVRAHLLAVHQERASAAAYLRFEASRLIEEYMSTVRSPQGWRLGSRFYVSLAASLRDTHEIDIALSYLMEALDAEPMNAHALFAAATIREKYGQYSGAADLLRRLIEQAPIPEARLRLALCRMRAGKLKQAEGLLEELARSASPSWVRAIAYQEWSQLRMRQGDPDTALQLASEGHQALPEDESLAVLVAFMSGPRDPQSRTLITRLTSSPTGTGLTARGIYNMWPPGVLTNEEILAREIEVRMPLLIEALVRRAGAAGEEPSPGPQNQRRLAVPVAESPNS